MFPCESVLDCSFVEVEASVSRMSFVEEIVESAEETGFLRVITIIGLLATATAFLDFSEEVLKESYDTETQKISVQLINPDVAVKFTRASEAEVNAVNLIADSSSTKATKGTQNACGNSLGIAIGNKKFCKISLLGLEVDHYRRGTQIRFALLFESDADLFLLDVPVFSTPSNFADEQEKLVTWAKKEKVGVDGPIDLHKLKQIRENEDITVRFDWLKKLLSHGIFKNKYERIIADRSPVHQAYVSRPLVLPENLLRDLIKVVDLFKLNDDDDFE